MIRHVTIMSHSYHVIIMYYDSTKEKYNMELSPPNSELSPPNSGLGHFYAINCPSDAISVNMLTA